MFDRVFVIETIEEIRSFLSCKYFNEMIFAANEGNMGRVKQIYRKSGLKISSLEPYFSEKQKTKPKKVKITWR